MSDKNRKGRPLIFRNCVGLAAGFDKHGESFVPLLAAGFGFVEVGSITPLAQDGNPKPRVFRLEEDEGVINRYGFNSVGGRVGKDNIIKGLIERERKKQEFEVDTGVLGINLGKNKLSPVAVTDYLTGIQNFSQSSMPNKRTGEYIVINVSSPNTPGLRGLQEKGKLESLLKACVDGVKKYNDKEEPPLLFVKIAPDLTTAELKDVASVIVESGVDGVIVSNTTNSRPDSLMSKNKGEGGGLSGKPLKELSTAVIREMYRFTGGVIPIIGVGGVSNADDAYEKIQAGAVAVQLYSSLTYKGLGVVSDIKKGLKERLNADGYSTVGEAVGKGKR